MNRLRAFIPAALLITASSFASAQPVAHLSELVTRYFRTPAPADRENIAEEITTSADGDWRRVAELVRSVSLWSYLPQETGRFPVTTDDATPLIVSYRLPVGYDPARRYPLILCYPSVSMTANRAFAQASILGDLADGFVLITPNRPAGATFHRANATANPLPEMMRRVRQLIHVDTDRVFAFGVGAGADAAWMAAINHSELFAGVVALFGQPRVPYAAQVYPFLLDNLASVPVLAVWSPVSSPLMESRRPIASPREAIEKVAADRNLPFTILTHDPGESGGSFLPRQALESLLQSTRAGMGAPVSRWFRYPQQGHAGWLRQSKFGGEIWEAPQLSIAPAPGTDYNEFIGGVIKSKLAHVGGSIDGQTITIETSKTARLDVLLSEELISLDDPVTIICNGRRRHRGPVKPDIATMLAIAYDDWEFQRLYPARVSISIKTDGR